MRIFKFGGASVKDPQGVKNVIEVLKQVKPENTLIVISAMGKTTNALEEVVNAYFEDKVLLTDKLQYIKNFHLQMANDLLHSTVKVEEVLNPFFETLDYFLGHNKSPDYNFVYDQIVSYGELLSIAIVSAFLNQEGISNLWLDVRDYIKTDSYYRDANIAWEQTEINIGSLQKDQLYITQGFLGSNPNGFTTTLGREGSDYTAAIFAYCLNATEVTIWKDVPGVFNADPRVFEDTTLLTQISYTEAIELAFYGASVIHPKTLQPLQSKDIPLHVKSFINPQLPGTTVKRGLDLVPETPCFIVKKNQHLVSISSKDFSFIMEDNISLIFNLLHQNQLKVNLIQNSAISFSVCIEDKYLNFNQFLSQLEDKFVLTVNKNVSLFTIRHYTQAAIEKIETPNKVLLKQMMSSTAQIVVSEQ